MTKAEFHELVVSLWQAGNTNSLKRPDFREVDLLAEIARNGAMRTLIEQNAAAMDDFYTPFIADVKFDPIRNKKYIILTSHISELSEPLLMISPIQNEEDQFIHVYSGDSWLFKGLESENAEGQTTYKVENGVRVWFTNINAALSQVLVRQIVNIVDLPDDAPFPVPQLLEQQILESVLRSLQIQETVNLKDEDKP